MESETVDEKDKLGVDERSNDNVSKDKSFDFGSAGGEIRSRCLSKGVPGNILFNMFTHPAGYTSFAFFAASESSLCFSWSISCWLFGNGGRGVLTQVAGSPAMPDSTAAQTHGLRLDSTFSRVGTWRAGIMPIQKR